MYNYKAHITKVLNCETITAKVDLGFKQSKEITFQLYGLNPRFGDSSISEFHTKHLLLQELIEGQEVELFTHKPENMTTDSYQVTVVMDGLDVNHWLAQSAPALEYAG